MERQTRALAIGADNVLSAWELLNEGNPYFAVFYNRSNKWFQYNKDNYEGAKKFLEDGLNLCEEGGDNSLYYLNVYDQPGLNYKNAGMVASIPFRLNEYTRSDASVNGYSGAGMGALTKMIQDQQEKQIALIKELEDARNAQKVDMWDRIGGLLEIDGVPQAVMPALTPVVAMIMGLVQKFTGVQPAQTPVAVPGLAGPPEQLPQPDLDAQLDESLDRLEKHCDLVSTMKMLADFADKNPTEFGIYMNILKGRV